MSLRHDLLELTPEALTALANAGFVKRAQKDLAAGQVPRLEVSDDGAVTAQFEDGVRTHLAPGRTLRDADCSCQASGMCRHRVLLVLSYQSHQAARSEPVDAGEPAAPPDEAWSPAEFDDAALAASFSPAVLGLAERMAAERPVVRLQSARAGQPPLAQLPMSSVRFFSRRALVHARCDCKMGSGCAHVVLAVWAFREAARQGRDASEAMVEVSPRLLATGTAEVALSPLETAAAREAVAQIEALVQSLWLDGSSQPLANLAGRVESLRAQLLSLGWSWVVDALEELWLLLQAQQARSSRFDAQRLLVVVTELWARVRAAGHAGQQSQGGATSGADRPASQILGVGVKGEVELDHLKLVSLGAVLWSDDTHEGADVLLADPDTQTVSVLAREWPRAEGGASAGQALASRRVAGFPLRQLASGQVITRSAKRRANGRIDIASGARQTGVMPLSPSAWDELQAPLRQTSAQALIEQLRTADPDFVLPRQAANGAAADAGGHLQVVSLGEARVVHSHWDAATQVLHAALAWGPDESAVDGAADDEVPLLYLALPHRIASAQAVDVLARALAGEWGALRAVAGTVQLQGGRAVMHPLALLTAQRGVVLQVEPAAAQPLPMPAGREDPPALTRVVAETTALLTLWLRQGLRHQASGSASRIQAQSQRLRQAGLRRCARLLDALPQRLYGEQRAGLVASLSTLVLLLQGLR